MANSNMLFIEDLITKLDCTTTQGRQSIKALIGEWEQEFKQETCPNGDDYLLRFIYREWVQDNG